MRYQESSILYTITVIQIGLPLPGIVYSQGEINIL